ncbi:TetR/AcrR family transcriptional regulator [Pseudonocardia spinosispora]|uniref:TetR/AcrR family transcriptional regulator n=1 Tax=Pseudonocardia spinosispora TaxID=103441 RepID=UPI000419E5BB|nr:TetR/AcrR family transcriptional regulator [Pseudonocardia spinosispora]
MAVPTTTGPTTGTRPERKRRAYAARVPSAQRRTQLLDAALHLVVTLGHQAVTMDAVAEQVGVTKPVVYGQFTSRTELLSELLRREQREALEQLRSLMPTASAIGSDPVELLTRLLTGFLEQVRRSPDRWRCIVVPMPDMPAEFDAAREEARSSVLSRLEMLLRGFVGARADLDCELLAHTVVSLFEMAARLTVTDPDRFEPGRFTAALRGCAARLR